MSEGPTEPREPRNPRKSGSPRKPRRVPQPKCPIRFGEPCTACQPGTSGPDDCQLVELVMDDPDLHERMLEMNRRMRGKKRAERAQAAEKSSGS